ncbi:MAG: protein phosphatase 2C domain-containing protein [Dysgonamonadaceae bacterium]|jgi:protein phosphatase|nr:protein phosphatase 2C domain-containing protein [Dysgonamonadaceae bacterium]
MAKVKLRLAARCEAAGRPNNEDNYLICENLSEGKWSFTTDREIELSEWGTPLVVADGMGGMNAGEVASALAIDSIKEWFSSGNLSQEDFSYPENIKDYIRKAIQAADRNIKRKGSSDESMSGMGSTVILAWLVGKYVYVGWCGDSRAYRFNTAGGLQQLSRDHSYVQELVDKGKLDKELAFDFPDRNIITRSLGDPRRSANPDVQEFLLRNGDIFLLCSDGLSGVLRDREIEGVISAGAGSMEACRDALWETSREAEWDDNVTIVLCQVLSGAEVEKASVTLKITEPKIPCLSAQEKQAEETAAGQREVTVKMPAEKKKSKKWLWTTIVIFLLAAGIYVFLQNTTIGNPIWRKFTAPPKNTDTIETITQEAVAPPVVIPQKSKKTEENEKEGKKSGVEKDKDEAIKDIIHIVRTDTSGKKETMQNIADMYGVEITKLRELNGNKYTKDINEGDTIKIPQLNQP